MGLEILLVCEVFILLWDVDVEILVWDVLLDIVIYGSSDWVE